ncbi:MAG: FAD-dependent oxidoreductase, partial [Actinomycetia bacterium]|nr:FAD-dependent oxidoreductase [Actinomycetes bacterium]
DLQSPALVNSDDVFALVAAPKRAVIVGGGYIAVEFAGIFSGLGIPTTLIYRGDQVLSGFDDDLRAVIGKAIAASGVDLRLNTTITGIETRSDTEVRCALSDGTTLDTDMLFHAIGRTPNLAGLGLEQVGLAPSKHGTLTVNDQFETAVAGIYAIGDVVGRYALTPIATGEATILARRLYGGFADTQTGARAIDYTLVPSAVFSQPEVATCGLTEPAALARGHTIDVYTTTFTPMLTSLSGIGDVHESAEALRESERIFMKLVIDHTSQVVLGCHMVGHGAADIIQGLAVALQAGVTKQQVDATIGIHPTSAEEFVTMRTATRTQITPTK